MTNHLQLQQNVFLFLLLTIVIAYVLYWLMLKMDLIELFTSKRELRMDVYGEYSIDPDKDMNNDNLLLRYLDK